MSTGYSGNLGYLIPNNWTFEQFVEKKNYSLANHTFDLDYDMASGKDSGIEALDLGFDKTIIILLIFQQWMKLPI